MLRSALVCMVCQVEIGVCACPDQDAQHKQPDPDGPLAARWCRSCDRHFARCQCDSPDHDWVRANGELMTVAETQRMTLTARIARGEI